MKTEFKKWLQDDYGLQESAAASRVSNISRIEKYYGDMDDIIESGRADDLLKDLSYSTDDERNNREAAHKIPVNGNLRTGSATLKQAMLRYMEFYQTIRGISGSSYLRSLYDSLVKSLGQFTPGVRKNSYTPDEVKRYIQIPLLHHLQKALPTVDWTMEFTPSEERKDSIDIFGRVNDDTWVIIEIDTERSDQVSKKFVSRQALSDDKNTIYVVLTYPNNNCNAESGRKELKKYRNYIISIVALLARGTDLEKYIYFHSL